MMASVSTSVIDAAFPGRAVVAVRATTLASRGGGPHCITQHVARGTGLERARLDVDSA
jgi:agmatine/peptidylarginine deiminase